MTNHPQRSRTNRMNLTTFHIRRGVGIPFVDQILATGQTRLALDKRLPHGRETQLTVNVGTGIYAMSSCGYTQAPPVGHYIVSGSHGIHIPAEDVDSVIRGYRALSSDAERAEYCDWMYVHYRDLDKA